MTKAQKRLKSNAEFAARSMRLIGFAWVAMRGEMSMKERPVVFNSRMVAAILGGHKTQMRRMLELPFRERNGGRWDFLDGACKKSECNKWCYSWIDELGNRISPKGKMHGCLVRPPCLPGDRFWVREEWMHKACPDGQAQPGSAVFFRADYLGDPLGPDLERSPDGIRRKWIRSLCMPRWASRIVLEVTGVRVERVSEISEQDARAEGFSGDDPVREFVEDWNARHGGLYMEFQPWAWVIEFSRIEE